MMPPVSEVLSTRELTPQDIEPIVRYWHDSEPAHLRGMGVDLDKRPSEREFTDMLTAQLALPVEERNAYCIIWMQDGRPIGHCNTNPTTFGEEAFMHLHIWEPGGRRRGAGAQLVGMTLPWFFDTLRLKRLLSEPYALNPAPNKTLLRAGFEFVQEHTTVPGMMNFEQPVKRWLMTRARFEQLYR